MLDRVPNVAVNCLWDTRYDLLRSSDSEDTDVALARKKLARVRREGFSFIQSRGRHCRLHARRDDFDPMSSDADFLVTFMPATRNDLAAFTDFKDALETLLGRPVDLLEREAIEASRNFIRRRRILAEAEAVYG